MTRADALGVLDATRPNFHGIDRGLPSNMQISPDVLGWLAANVPVGGTSLETGSGYSTVIFASRSTRHIAIAPARTEFDAIRAFCVDHDLPTESLDAHIGISQQVLPALDLPPLDVVLIDGDHAFPAPFLDYYYVADHVKEGGHVLVDDCQLRTGHILRQFLMAEPGWEHDTDLGRTAVFRRSDSVPPTSRWWGQQPWGTPRYAVAGDPLAHRLASLRTQLRLRSRLKRLL